MSDDFIEVYEGAFSEEYCKKVISAFDRLHQAGFTWNRQDEGHSKLMKDDDSFQVAELIRDFSDCDSGLYTTTIDLFNSEFTEMFSKCTDEYISKYPALNNSRVNLYGNKVQKTEAGGGYHQWHYENVEIESSRRVLAYTVYLNDIEEGGETEFLYQRKRVEPKTGRCVIFPTAFTHTHRGNPPLSGTKYILTGWLEY